MAFAANSSGVQPVLVDASTAFRAPAFTLLACLEDCRFGTCFAACITQNPLDLTSSDTSFGFFKENRTPKNSARGPCGFQRSISSSQPQYRQQIVGAQVAHTDSEPFPLKFP